MEKRKEKGEWQIRKIEIYTNIGIARVLNVGGFGDLAGLFEEKNAIEVVVLQIHGTGNLPGVLRALYG